jgi:acetyl esterase/lipase
VKPAQTPSTEIRLSLGVPFGDLPRHRLDVAVPEDARGALVVCLPAGYGERHRHDLRPLLIALAEAGWPAAGLELIRPQDVRDPQMPVADLRTAVAKAADEAAILGAPAEGVVILAGGANALVAWSAAQAWSGRSQPLPRLRGLVALGLPATTDPTQLTGNAVAGLRHLIPLGEPAEADPAKLPPALLVHGEQDPDVPARLIQPLFQRFEAAGHPVQLATLPGTGHWLDQPHAKTGAEVLARVTAFLDQHAVRRGAVPLFAGRLPDA